MTERAYLQKDVAELTSQDLAEMLEDYNAATENREEINKELANLQKKQAALMVNLAIVEAMAEADENTKAGAITALDAFLEYAKKRGGTVRGFFRDPDLPEILQRVRDRAIELLRERTAENDAAEALALPIPVKNIELMLDKPNNHIWNLLAEETTGQIVFDLAGEAPKGTPAKAPAFYSINFDELDQDETFSQIARRLTPYDKRVYIAIGALYNAKNATMSLTQIYYAMGNQNRPNSRQLSKVKDSVIKMMRALVTLNHSDKAEELGYEKYTHTTHLLPAVIDEGITYNPEVKSSVQIRPLTEPPLLTYAKIRKQVTTFPANLLQGPGSKTDTNIAIEDYLLDAIAHAKRSKEESIKRLYSTICERTRQTTKKQQDRVPEKVIERLTYYVKCRHIKGFKRLPEGVIIEL